MPRKLIDPEISVIEKRCGNPDAVRDLMRSVTLDWLSSEFGVAMATAKVWETRYQVRCQRTCRRCKRTLPYDQFLLRNKSRGILCCLDCGSVEKKRPAKGRMELEVEFNLTPPAVFAACRMPMSSQTGRWSPYALDDEIAA